MFSVHCLFVLPTPEESHYAGTSSYDISSFVEKDADLLHPSYVTVSHGSSDSLVAKLMSGPSISTEKHQPDMISRKSVEFVAEFHQAEFCEKYRSTMRGSDAERFHQCVQSNGWLEGVDFALGHQKIS